MKTMRMTESAAVALMRKVCKKHDITLVFLKENEGYGGYRYGASIGGIGATIWIAPFAVRRPKKKYATRKVKCHNPIECMLATFFHEFAHCRLTDKIPSHVDGYSFNDTSKFQYEAWVTMMGLEFAHAEYGIRFSDATVKWALDENYTYADISHGVEDCAKLYARKVTCKGYEVVQTVTKRDIVKPTRNAKRKD